MKNPFRSSYTKEELDMFSFLSQVPLFDNLTAKEKSYFLPYIHERNYKKDEAVYFRDDPSHALYIIKSGTVELNIDINKDLERLAVIGRGKVMGENCLLKNTRRLYNAITASETSTMYVIPQDSIFFIFEDHMQVRVKMLEALAEINNHYHTSLMKVYKSSLGFFNLAQVFARMQKK
ncbi:MAG: cyclic nucleotide-binding domain-containing protein [Candidatus Cyclobacteriaceae bacterium M2_1C_046]